MATKEARYSLTIGNLSLQKNGEGKPMFTIKEVTWHDLDYAGTVALQEALYGGPISMGKAIAEALEESPTKK